MHEHKIISGYLVDIIKQSIYKVAVHLLNGKIDKIKPLSDTDMVEEHYILPGFIDAHIHIESSMMSPSAFAAIALQHGTVATVSDPHEIANVCGMEGIQYMIQDGEQAPLKFYFGAPSCVPATSFETAGAIIDANDIRTLMQLPHIKYLSEMMNFPGVLHRDPIVMDKIEVAKQYGKPIDGHAPGLSGNDALQYIRSGITTDHECTTFEEALFKAQNGMHILIREGSAAKNFDALIPLLKHVPKQLMFCSDDKHPDALIQGHINQLVQRAIALGYDLYDVLYAACILPVLHYKLEVGLLQEGDNADFIIVKDLTSFAIKATYINGNEIVKEGKSTYAFSATKTINQFVANPVSIKDIANASHPKALNRPIIAAIDGQLITEKINQDTIQSATKLWPNVADDILKIVVINRYKSAQPTIAFIKNFGLQKGALASSVAHDSHNIVAVGVSDEAIIAAVNAIIASKGGISLFDGYNTSIMPLPIAGLMSDKDAYTVAREYEAIDAKAKALGTPLTAPFMTLSFMALPVIPHLKITDKGLFDVDTFKLLD